MFGRILELFFFFLRFLFLGECDDCDQVRARVCFFVESDWEIVRGDGAGVKTW